MAVVYVSPTGSGSFDGGSWANAAGIGQLSSMIGKAGPGGTVLLRSDQGAYRLDREIQLSQGGSTDAPVTIKGVNGAGQPSAAVIHGVRDTTWTPGESYGNDTFRLLGGANNLVFSHLDIRDTGNAFRLGANLQNITVQNVSASNVGRFVQDLASGGATSATVDGLTIRDVSVSGYSDKAFFLQYGTHNVLMERVTADAGGQKSQYQIGVHLDGAVYDVTLRSVTMNNNRDTVSSSTAYQQGDGFATEGGVRNVRFENTRAVGNTDAGYDLKSSDTVLVDAYAEGNKRNYRIWGDNVVMERATGTNPVKSGGTGETAQVWLGGGADLTVINSTFKDVSTGGMVFDLENNAQLDVQGGTLVGGLSNWTARLGDGAGARGLAGTVNNGLRISGNGSAETLEGGSGADRLAGGGGDDVLEGGAGDDTLTGGYGADTASYARAANGVTVSLAVGGAQNTGAGWDTLNEMENLRGSNYADTLTGNGAANALQGGGGNDILTGGSGADLLSGGAGSDVFVFRSVAEIATSAPDRITDFGWGDRLDLRLIDADTGRTGDQAFRLDGSGAAGTLQLTYDGGLNQTKVLLHVNGDRTPDAAIILDGDFMGLTATDFML